MIGDGLTAPVTAGGISSLKSHLQTEVNADGGNELETKEGANGAEVEVIDKVKKEMEITENNVRILISTHNAVINFSIYSYRLIFRLM